MTVISRFPRRRWAAIGLLAASGLVSACASTTLRSTQRAPDFQAKRIHKVLVVCLSAQALREFCWKRNSFANGERAASMPKPV